MPFDDVQQPDFGGGGFRKLTPVGYLMTEFRAASVEAIDSESEEALEAFFAAWDRLQNEPSVEANDILLKLSAFKIRYDSVVISYSVICESDVLHLDTLAMEAVDALYPHISMDG